MISFTVSRGCFAILYAKSFTPVSTLGLPIFRMAVYFVGFPEFCYRNCIAKFVSFLDEHQCRQLSNQVQVVDVSNAL